MNGVAKGCNNVEPRWCAGNLAPAQARPDLDDMCGRYVFYRPIDEIRAIFAAMGEMPNFEPSWNVAPTQLAPVMRRHPKTGERRIDLLRWGLVPHFVEDPASSRQPINARSETAATSPMFKGALERRRCLVPADAFYEWTSAGKTKQAHAAARADGQPMALAGIWEGWRGADGMVMRSYAILTTTSCPALAHLHARMAVVLEPNDWPLWLGETEGDVGALMRPSEAAFRVWTVGPRVGNVRNNDSSLLDSWEPTVESQPFL
jgi:putative SOS response-associated peptidase YedK